MSHGSSTCVDLVSVVARAITWAAMMLASPSVATAQAQPLTQVIDSGSLARLTWDGGARHRVRLLAPLGPTSDSVRFCLYPAATCRPGSMSSGQIRTRADLVQVEVPRGTHLQRGTLIGAGIGLLTSLWLVGWLDSDETGPSTGRKLLVGGLAFSVPTALGALLGGSSEVWTSLR